MTDMKFTTPTARRAAGRTFPPLTIPRRLGLLVAVAVLVAMAAFAVQLLALRDTLDNERRVALRNEVQTAVSVLQSFIEDAKAGRLGESEAQERAKAALRTIRFGNGDYFFAYGPNGVNLVLGPKPELEGKSLIDAKDPGGVPYVAELLAAAQRGGGYVSYGFPRAGQQAPSPKLGYAVSLAPWGWMVGSGVYIDDVDAIFSARLSAAVAWLGGLIVLLGLCAWLIARGIVRPVRAITATMTKLATGDVRVTVPIDRRDEIGDMARAVEVFKDHMIEADRLRGEQDAMIRDAEAEKKRFMGKMADDFESGVRAALDAVGSSATTMRTTSHGMSATAEETSRQATTVAAAAEQASANVQTVAAAAEELSSSVAEIGRQVTQSTTIAGQAVAEANRTNVSVRGLSEAAHKIGDVVKLISDIASQTNLLALNATIEAARAGDAGKGFAVVASEVKSLANQTAKATEEIAAQVAAMQGATNEAVEAIRSIGGTIGSINEIATTIASAVEEQGAATQEIARNVHEASQGTGQVSSNIVGVNQAVAETGMAAGQVLAAADELGRQAATLRSDVESFLAKIRAA
jgi:methyl-accepting chemotaxis protein